jgi:hypothetical protein
MIIELISHLFETPRLWLTSWFHPARQEIWFTTLGMVVLDELVFPSKTVADVVGGSGTYSKLSST